MSTLVLNGWPAIAQAGVAAVGGKAAALARLAALDFPVPAGLAVPAAVGQAWLGPQDGPLHAACLQAAQALADDHGAALQALAPRLRQHPPPEALVDALRLALAQPPWQGQACAVRSSAPQEDSAVASFAGIHRSVLNVAGPEAVADAVVEVWASLWTPAAVAYRQRIGLPHTQAAMAVLVMPLVAARAAGIAFSCEPSTGRDDRLVVHANHGLGDSLVDGVAAGDEAVLQVNRQDECLDLVAYRLGPKQQHSRPRAAGGTERHATAPAQAGQRVLSDAQVLQLGQLLRLAATALGDVTQAQDMEWAWDGARFWLLQARPVTATARCTYPALQGLPDIWSRGNTVDVLPHPLSPVEWTTGLGTCNTMLESGWRLAGYPLHPGIQRVRIIEGRMYLNMSVLQWECFDGFGLLPGATNRMAGGHQPEIPVPPPSPAHQRQVGLRKLRYMLRGERLRRRGRRQIAELQRHWKDWRQRPLPTDDASRSALLRALMQRVRTCDGMLFMQGSGAGALSTLVDMLEARLPGEGHAVAAALMAGGPRSVSAQQGYDLVAVAQTAQADDAARAWLAQPGDQRGDWRGLPTDSPFRQAFAAFIERYGHRGIYETYLRNPRWFERPDDLLDSLPDLARKDMAALAQHQRDSAAQAWQRVKAACPWWQRMAVRGVLRAAQRDSNDREAARSGFIGGAEPLRRLLLAIGHDWAGRGWLDEAADILCLMAHETRAVLDGQRPGPALRPLVARRKADLQRWQQTVPREVVVQGDASRLRSPGQAAHPIDHRGSAGHAGIAQHTDAQHTDAHHTAARHHGPTDGAGLVLRGVAVGSGQATGRVRQVRDPADGAALRPGEVLLAPSTDPAWTPLFLRAAALVVETGGFMSHGAIVAREFGIPAVVNLPGAMARLHDGDLVRVDSATGTVTRLAAPDPTAPAPPASAAVPASA